jgi:DNA-binding CsgD family transcriptional regulator/tetratricopeptide (TPR) repeat protein
MWENAAMHDGLSSGAFVGRAAELDLLDATLAALSERGAATVLVGGEAGIGKSRLMEEFAARALSRGALVAIGGCTPTDSGGLPYGPIVSVLRDVSRQLVRRNSGGDANRAIEAAIGLARRHLGLVTDDDAVTTAGADAIAPAPTANLLKTKLFEAVLDSVDALSQRSPVVLVFEDLQWADSASAEVIDFLTRNLVDRPALLVCTYRTDEVSPGGVLGRFLPELGRHGRVSRFELAGLDRPEMATMLTNILGTTPDWALIDAVQARSAGNPFFAEELAAARQVSTLPTSLRDVVMIRIERLSPQARQVVAIAATAGTSFHHRLLSSAAAAAHLDHAALDAAIAEAVESHVLVADPTQGSLRFRHALLREAAYDVLLPGERSRLHAALATALTQHPELAAAGPGHAVIELADHWWEAADWPKAFTASVIAADAAVSLLAMREAYLYYDRALTAAGYIGPDAASSAGVDWIDLLMRAAESAYMAGQTPRSVELVRNALDVVDADTDPRRAAICYTLLGRNAWSSGQSQLQHDSLQRAADLLGDSPSLELAGVVAEEARSLMLTAQYARAEGKARAAVDMARAVGARAEEGSSLNTLGVCLASRGEFDQGLALLREAIVIAEEVGEPDQLNRAYSNLAYVLIDSGRLEEAARIPFEDTSSEHLIGIRITAAAENSAGALIRLGRLDEAEDLLGRISDRGAGVCANGPGLIRAEIAIRRGRLDEAVAQLAAAEALSVGLDTVGIQGSLHTLRAEIHLEAGEPHSATLEVERALTYAAGSEDDAFTVEMLALGLRSLADEVDELRALRRPIDHEKIERLANGMVGEINGLIDGRTARREGSNPDMLSFAATGRAEASRVLGPDPDLWREAANRWAATHDRYRVAYCSWREAQCLLAARLDRRRAVECAQSAWRTAVAVGSPLLQARVERLAERARIPLIDLESAAPTAARKAAEDLGLTPREVEVLAQLARGRTDRQIAEELFISKKTASVHVSNLLRKLDATNRLEAAEIGQRALLV